MEGLQKKTDALLMITLKKNKMNKSYWEQRYINGKTGWDIGKISTPIKEYIDQLTHKYLKILIPGAGNGFEAEYLWKNGFKNTFLIDIALQPINNFKKRVPNFPESQLIKGDFFDLKMEFDLILEQTFFCVLSPKLRQKYCDKMFDILKPKGKIVGLFFDFPLTEKGPPFGGNASVYKKIFDSKFKINCLERATNSILERQGKELFFIFEKKTS